MGILLITIFRCAMSLVSFIVMLDIVMVSTMFSYMFVERLAYFMSRLGGRLYVGAVLRYSLPVNAPYVPGRVADTL